MSIATTNSETSIVKRTENISKRKCMFERITSVVQTDVSCVKGIQELNFKSLLCNI